MKTTTTHTLTPTTLALFARQHANLMFSYYVTRALLEAGYFAESGAAAESAAHASAVQSRRSGFALEREVERCGVRLGDYDEEQLRRDAYRAAQLLQTDEAAAAEHQQRAVEAVASAAVAEVFGQPVALPLAA